MVTRQPGYAPEGVLVFASIDAALTKAKEIALADGAEEVMIIGGGEIYAQLLDRADRLYISHVDLAPAGEIVFPAIDPSIWEVIDQPAVTPSEKDAATYRVNVYARRTASAH